MKNADRRLPILANQFFHPLRFDRSLNIYCLMKKYISFFTIAFFFFSSCSKDALVFPDISQTIQVRSSTSEIQVSAVSQELNSAFLIIEFSSTADFTEVNIDSEQDLIFTSNGNSITLSFQVESSQIVKENLEITFDLESYSLIGFELQDVQSIIIVDGLVE